SSSYMPFAASGESSRNGVFGSSSAAMRSRGGSFPCWTCRSRYFGPPPCRAFASRSFNSSTSDWSRCALVLKSSEEGSRWVSSASIRGGVYQVPHARIAHRRLELQPVLTRRIRENLDLAAIEV